MSRYNLNVLLFLESLSKTCLSPLIVSLEFRDLSLCLCEVTKDFHACSPDKYNIKVKISMG